MANEKNIDEMRPEYVFCALKGVLKLQKLVNNKVMFILANPENSMRQA